MTDLESLKIPNLNPSFEGMNNSLTEMMDAMFGTDQTDSFDASCNTCKHFQRKPMTPEEKAERNIFGMPGTCGLDGTKVYGQARGMYCGYENRNCYENRRTGMRPREACKA